MGLTLYCKKTGRSINMGYGGFNRLREKVANLVGEPFASHYAKLSTPEYMFCLNAEKAKQLFAEYDAQTARMLDQNLVSHKVADFLLQSDCEGKVRYGACKEILQVIGNYNDDHICYGYNRCASDGWVGTGTMADFKSVLQDCVDNRCMMIWS